MPRLSRCLRAVDRLSGLVGGAVAVLVPLMTLVICYEVVARYFFNAPTIWAHDLAVFMFGYLGILSGAYVQRRHRHITVDVVHIHLSPRARAALDVISGLLAFFFLGLVAVYGWHKAMEAFEIGARMSTEWGPPKAHFMLMVPLGAVLLILQSLADWLRNLHLAVSGRRPEA